MTVNSSHSLSPFNCSLLLPTKFIGAHFLPDSTSEVCKLLASKVFFWVEIDKKQKMRRRKLYQVKSVQKIIKEVRQGQKPSAPPYRWQIGADSDAAAAGNRALCCSAQALLRSPRSLKRLSSKEKVADHNEPTIHFNRLTEQAS